VPVVGWVLEVRKVRPVIRDECHRTIPPVSGTYGPLMKMIPEIAGRHTMRLTVTHFNLDLVVLKASRYGAAMVCAGLVMDTTSKLRSSLVEIIRVRNLVTLAVPYILIRRSYLVILVSYPNRRRVKL
jgi:hypothetical protein